MDTAIYSLSIAAIAFLAVIAFKPFDTRLTLGFGLLFAGYLGLDDLATGLPYIANAFNFNPARWNWAGKIYSLVLSAAVILALGIKPAAVGLTLSQKNLKVSLLLLLVAVPWGVSLGLVYGPPSPSAETIAFQASMPGLAEELAYRGIAPALLLGLIRGKDCPQGTPWAVVCIAAIMFGVWHGLSYSDGSFSFDLSAWNPFIGGIVMGWWRFYSGSLLFPILFHCLANVAFHLTGLMGV